MNTRHHHLKADPTQWLLEPDGSTELTEASPSVRYFTLIDILDRRADDPEVCAARAAIPAHPPVAELLAAGPEIPPPAARLQPGGPAQQVAHPGRPAS